MKAFRVLLADDHALVRAGLRKLLESFSGIEVVGEAADGRRVLVLAEELQPDLVLMDISMPGLSGLMATVRLLKAWPKMRVLILSMHQNEEFVREALRKGASGYMLKDSAPRELELAIKSVQDGNIYLSPAISKSVNSTRNPADEPGPGGAEPLTPRQTEVLCMVAQGMSSKDIARQLNVSIKTVDSHRTGLMKQLDIHEVTGLVRYAIRTGLISPGP
jgi:DNA-binding NarL/FixJ family response regulator